MSDLSPINASLERLKKEITEIKRGKRGNHSRPHKLVMLLAVIELAERGLLPENKIYLSNALIQIFENIFVLVKRKDDLCQPGPPFFHLRTSGFWYHKVRPEKQDDYYKLTTTGGGIQVIEEYIEYAYLRQGVYELLQDQAVRRKLRLFISQLLKVEKE
jgi:predicted restriction endonuclease